LDIFPVLWHMFFKVVRAGAAVEEMGRTQSFQPFGALISDQKQQLWRCVRVTLNLV